VLVRHCVVDQGMHCFFTNAELPFMTDCPARPGGPLAHDMIWAFASDWALARPVPEPLGSRLLAASVLVLGVLARRRARGGRGLRT
jgi:hypothetical protein